VRRAAYEATIWRVAASLLHRLGIPNAKEVGGSRCICRRRHALQIQYRREIVHLGLHIAQNKVVSIFRTDTRYPQMYKDRIHVWTLDYRPINIKLLSSSLGLVTVGLSSTEADVARGLPKIS
jgi:hypothetical protein